ncbi:TATA box-binding protein-associated factor RNA polymerase I subunit A-like [Centruroides vittatus]|uniref:TATA box-binding protein-associated factor RNA polymerase I subunit A-like n=1 Tax=Centruroides vittatus TaxID=120091 RepID=UPI0035108D14
MATLLCFLQFKAMNFHDYRIIPLTDKDSINKLTETVKFLNAAFENPAKYLRTDNLSQYSETKVCFKSKHIRKMLKKCIVKHQYVKAAKILECLSYETDSPQLIFKAGFQTLENHPNTTQDTILQFVRHLLCLHCLYKSEIVLECVVYLIKHNRFQEAQQQLQAFGTNKARQSLRTDPLIEEILCGYNGLLHYIEWAQKKVKIDRIDDPLDLYSEEEATNRCAERALNIFQNLLKNPGRWDIFILKVIEILESYGKIDDIEDALVQYAEINPDHLNAYIYLLEFSTKHSFLEHKQEEYLQKIKSLCPSDKRILNYVSLIEEKDVKSSVDILLDYLNYASNKDDIQGWTMLADILLQILNNSINIDLDDIWSEYESFWPSYQFSAPELNVTDRNSAKLVLLKAIVLSIFEDVENGHPYLETASEKLNESPFHDLCSEFNDVITHVKNLKKS